MYNLMATSLDMSLDDIIKKSRGNRERGRGRGRAPRGRGGPARGSLAGGRMAGAARRGPFRVNQQPTPYTIAKSIRKTKNFPWRHDLFEDSLRAAGIQAMETSTKLYVSNLDHGVTNEDIKELFADIGELKRFTVHYDKNGRPSGSAEVVYVRRSDAFAALKRYNNVQLDGKPMKIEIIGANSEVPVSARVNVVGGGSGRRRRTVIMESGVVRAGGSAAVNRGSSGRRSGSRGGLGNAGPGRGRGGLGYAGRGRGGGRGRGRGRGYGIGKKQPIEKSVGQLDKELESYHAEAMHTS